MTMAALPEHKAPVIRISAEAVPKQALIDPEEIRARERPHGWSPGAEIEPARRACSRSRNA